MKVARGVGYAIRQRYSARGILRGSHAGELFTEQ